VAPQYGGGISNYKVSEDAMSETDDGLLTAAIEGGGILELKRAAEARQQ
jgi:hypothetical protein